MQVVHRIVYQIALDIFQFGSSTLSLRSTDEVVLLSAGWILEEAFLCFEAAFGFLFELALLVHVSVFYVLQVKNGLFDLVFWLGLLAAGTLLLRAHAQIASGRWRCHIYERSGPRLCLSFCLLPVSTSNFCWLQIFVTENLPHNFILVAIRDLRMLLSWWQYTCSLASCLLLLPSLHASVDWRRCHKWSSSIASSGQKFDFLVVGGVRQAWRIQVLGEEA